MKDLQTISNTVLEPTNETDRHVVRLWLHGRPQNTLVAYQLNLARFNAYVGKGLLEVTLVDIQAFADLTCPLCLVQFSGSTKQVRLWRISAVATGRRFRTQGVSDTCTREALAIEVDTSLPGERVVRVLEQLIIERGRPTEIVLDIGSELISRVLDQWAVGHGIKLGFIEPSKPEQNAVMESFNGRFRDECLNIHWFTSLADARRTIEAWRLDYHQLRPHSSLAYRTPTEMYAQLTRSFITMEAAGLS